jgi:predicted Abi (CAAX) family protease
VKLTIAICLSAMSALAPACTLTPDAGGDATSSESAQTATLPSDRYRAVAAWTGRLVLPATGERRPDGAVEIELHNAGDSSFAGKTVWLRWDGAPDVQERVRDVTVDVRFDDRANKSMQKGNVHPTRLDGWSRVGPLESLAGAHRVDDVLVSLPDAKLVGGELVIAREPVIVPGDFVALLQVERPTGDGADVVRHFSRATHDFTGAEETLAFDAPPLPLGGNGPVLSPVAGIERSPANRFGFYAHGVVDAAGKFHVRALVPRPLRAIPSVNVRSGASSSLLFTTAGMWDPVATAEAGKAAKGTLSTTLLTPDGFEGDAGAERYRASALGEGSELLVIHTFGSVGPTEASMRTGHFSFGVAKVVREPLSGDLALDVEYRQVYAHNPNGILSGTHSWASYAGSFDRGWMYGRPIADVALALPALTRTYDLGGVRFRPLDGIVSQLESMTERYRTGMGTGAAIVTPANSCVQDSSKALFFALVQLEDRVESDPRVSAYVAANPADPQVKDYQTLVALADETQRYLSPFGITRRDWRAQAHDLAAVSACPGGIVGAVFCGLASYQTIFPRHASDLYTEALVRAGAGGVVTRTNDVVGDMPGIFPLSPTAP